MKILDCKETALFYRRNGELQQRLDITLADTDNALILLRVETANAKMDFQTEPKITDGIAKVNAFAPCVNRRTNSPQPAILRILKNGKECATKEITIGSFRPWTIHVLSDVCADDVWAYDDVVKHDRDDYVTTLTELKASAGNSYNLPASRQLERFLFHASSEEKDLIRSAIFAKRLFVSMIPNQLNPAAFILFTYPEILAPYRLVMKELGLEPANFATAAYHMEGPTWTLGLAKLLYSAGVKLFAKSLLRYQAPWIERIAELPRLTRYEIAPNQFCVLSLHCNGYGEAGPINDENLDKVNHFINNELLPSFERYGAEYPSSHLPLAGMYGDLSPRSPEFAKWKLASIERYNAQGWEYPKVVNSTWTSFAEAVAQECGGLEQPKGNFRVIRGDAGSSWDGWMMSVQNEHARFRKLQRQLNDIQTLNALIPNLEISQDELDAITLDVVHLGDHAWNGFDDGTWNASIYVRRRRISSAEKRLANVWKKIFEAKPANFADENKYAVVNTLGWTRDCELEALLEWNSSTVLYDPDTKETFYPAKFADDKLRYFIPAVPAYGARILEKIQKGNDSPMKSSVVQPLLTMRPILFINSKEVSLQGGWKKAGEGQWSFEKLSISAYIENSLDKNAQNLFVQISGIIPDGIYELSWLFTMPWKTCSWLMESGGAFIKIGNTSQGGDSLEGVIGSVSVAGEGLQAISPNAKAILFAFNETGICGLGRRTTKISLPRGENEAPDNDSFPYQDSTLTEGKLYWFLLGSELNGRESYKKQMGASSWQFHCRIQPRDTALSAAEMYRFACGANRPAVIIPAKLWQYGKNPALQIGNSNEVLPLGLSRRGAETEINLFNCDKRPVQIKLEGELTKNNEIFSVNMLGGNKVPVSQKQLEIPAENFQKILLERKMNNISPMTEVAMILPEGTPIPDFALPAGYTVRKYKSAEDRATWVRIVRLAEKHHSVIDENLHRAQFGEDEKILSERQLFLVAPDGTDIGTVTAWFDKDYNGQEWGRFHWLSIVPEYQGRGLAKPFVAITLKLLRELGHQRIRLTTELVRTNAINIYLKFGFVPDMSYPNAKTAWEAFENKKFD